MKRLVNLGADRSAGWPRGSRRAKAGQRPGSNAPLIKNRQLVELPIPTRAGVFWAHYSATGLAGLDFPSANSESRSASSKSRKKAEVRKPQAHIARWHRTTTAALKAVLAGARRNACRRWIGPGKRNFSKPSGANCASSAPARPRATAKLRKRLAIPRPSAPWAARAGPTRFPCSFRAIAFSPPTRKSAASPAAWSGSGGCSKRKESGWKSSRGQRKRILFLRRQGGAEEQGADEQVNPADDQVHPKGETQLHDVKSPDAIEHQRQ